MCSHGKRWATAPACHPCATRPQTTRPRENGQDWGKKRGKCGGFDRPTVGKQRKAWAQACAWAMPAGVCGMPTAFQSRPPVGKVLTFGTQDRRPPFMREIFPTGFLQKRPGGLGGSRSLGCPRKGRERESFPPHATQKRRVTVSRVKVWATYGRAFSGPT